jgi:hypothetical protein
LDNDITAVLTPFNLAVHLAAEIAGTGTGILDRVKATVPVTVAFER